VEQGGKGGEVSDEGRGAIAAAECLYGLDQFTRQSAVLDPSFRTAESAIDHIRHGFSCIHPKTTRQLIAHTWMLFFNAGCEPSSSSAFAVSSKGHR
jgi:hypothetical protein